MTWTIRPFRASDTERLIEVLHAVFGEYGMRFDPEGYDRDVKDVLGRYREGVFFTAELDGKVLGFGGADLPRAETAEIHRLYIDPAARGKGLGGHLVERLEEWARPRARSMILWSDVRFFHAHDLYARHGYRLTGQRTLEDPDRSVEFGFKRTLSERKDDRPFVADFAYEALHALGPEERHRAAMIAAAIQDSRKLPRGPDRAHLLPAPEDLFAPGLAVDAIFQRPRILAGFRAALDRRLHPLFSARLSSR